MKHLDLILAKLFTLSSAWCCGMISGNLNVEMSPQIQSIIRQHSALLLLAKLQICTFRSVRKISQSPLTIRVHIGNKINVDI